jgi:hypothetical protein
MDDTLLPAVQKAYDLNRWLLPQVERFDRKYKFTLGARIQETALDLCLALVEAGHSSAKERPLYRANRLLDQLRLLLRLCRDLHVFSVRRYEYVTSEMEQLGRMVGGWLRSARSGLSPRSPASEPDAP